MGVCRPLRLNCDQAAKRLSRWYSQKKPASYPPFFTMATAAVEEIRASSYVGFDSITRQIEHKLLKRGFQFNVIVVGMYHPCVCKSLLCCN